MYRSLPESGPTCDAHSAAPARARCAACDAQVCTPCSLYVGLSLLCPRCAKRSWRRSLLGRNGARAALALAFAGAAALTARFYLHHHDDPFDWGERAPAIHRLQARLAAHPCDQPALLAIAEQYERAYDPWSAKQTLANAIAICPLDESVHRHQLSLLMGQHQWSDAIRSATQLITLQPEVADHYYQRGYAEQMDGEPARAAEDYIEALRRDPSRRDAGIALVNLYTSVGRGDVASRVEVWMNARDALAAALPPLPSFEHEDELW